MRRRELLSTVLASGTLLALGGRAHGADRARDKASRGILNLRIGAATGPAPGPGWHRLDLDPGRDALLFVPVQRREPTPLLVLFHGAGGTAAIGSVAQADAERLGVAVLVPESRGTRWDLLAGGFGPDVAFIDRAIGRTAEQLAIDPDRLVFAGFSDGGSYALALGLRNGDRLAGIIALSPGFLDAGRQRGRPPVFVIHGTEDEVLPIDVTSRAIVPDLRRRGLAVDYQEFQGRHVVKADLLTRAMDALFANDQR